MLTRWLARIGSVALAGVLSAACSSNDSPASRSDFESSLADEGYVTQALPNSETTVCLLRDGIAQSIRLLEIEPSEKGQIASEDLAAEDVESWGQIYVWEAGSVQVTYFGPFDPDPLMDTLTELLGNPVAAGGQGVTGSSDVPPPARNCAELS